MAELIPFSRNRNIARPGNGTFYNMLDDFFSEPWFSSPWPTVRSLMSDTFKMDVKENDGGYVIEAELPGIGRDEITLTSDDGKFTISVNRNEETSNEDGGYLHKERRSSSMSRSVYLAGVDAENVNAKLEDGVLRISIPKTAPEVSKRQIEIL